MGAAIEQEADGIDLGTDSGRLAARILIAVAKAAHERKSERQKLANEADAIGGKRRTGTPRPGREAAVEHACKLIRSGPPTSGCGPAGNLRRYSRPARRNLEQHCRPERRQLCRSPRAASPATIPLNHHERGIRAAQPDRRDLRAAATPQALTRSQELGATSKTWTGTSIQSGAACPAKGEASLDEHERYGQINSWLAVRSLLLRRPNEHWVLHLTPCRVCRRPRSAASCPEGLPPSSSKLSPTRA